MISPTDAEDPWRSVLRQSDWSLEPVNCRSAVLLPRRLYDAAMECPLHCTCPGENEGSSVAQAAGTTLDLRWRTPRKDRSQHVGASIGCRRWPLARKELICPLTGLVFSPAGCLQHPPHEARAKWGSRFSRRRPDHGTASTGLHDTSGSLGLI